MTHNKRKTLRQLYQNDPAARDFLKNHPEFDDRFLEEKGTPQWDINKGRYTLQEVAPDQEIYGTVMLEALNALPDNHTYKPLLEAYYLENRPLNEIQKRFKIKSINALWQKLHRAKKAALRVWIRPKHNKNTDIPIAEREVINGDRRATLYLRYCGNSTDTVWTLKDGTILPESVQDILDNNIEYKEWDLIFIDALT